MGFSLFTLFNVFIATMGGFCQGYEVGGTAQVIVMPAFRVYFGLAVPDGQGGFTPTPDSANLESNIVSLCIVGSIVGAFILIFTGDYMGRKGALFVGSGFLAIGAAIAAASTSIGMLYAGRILGGVGIGFLSGTVGVYLAEITPADIRGAVTSGFQLMITIGIAFGNIITIGILKNVYNTSTNDLAWRWGLGCQAIFAGIVLIGLPFCPESPRWCVQHEKMNRAIFGVKRITQSDEGSAAYEALMSETKELVEAEKKLGEAKWSDLAQRGIWNRIGIACALMVFQQWSGINAALYYAPSLFIGMGFEPSFASTVTATISSVVNVVMTFPAILLVDRLGRKFLLFWGAAAMALFMWGLVLFCNLVESNPTDAISALAATCMYLYIASFAMSWGPVPWTVIAEIFPLRISGKGAAIATMVNWLMNFVIQKVWPFAQASLGPWQYSIFGTMMVVGAIFTLTCVPETKGRLTEQMDELFQDPSNPFHPKEDFAAIFGRTPETVEADKFDMKRVGTADSIAYRAGTIKRNTM
ncbi:general substrate transporter [Hyaloraphidium curvatum]|nr:general substrate transporter [Hyaloraphidium curvatum]